MQMSSLKSFVILDEDDKGNIEEAADLALTLDLVDFSSDQPKSSILWVFTEVIEEYIVHCYIFIVVVTSIQPNFLLP